MRAVLSRWFTVKKKHVLYFLASFAILALVLYQADLGKVAGVLSKARLELVFLGFVLTVANLFCKVVRWKTFTDAHKIKISWLDNASTYLASLFIANVTPARVGEATRPLLMKKRVKAASFFGLLPAIIIERFMDMLFLLITLAFFLFAVSFTLDDAFRYALVLIGFVMLFVLFILLNKSLAKTVVNAVFRVFSFLEIARKARPKINELMERFYTG